MQETPVGLIQFAITRSVIRYFGRFEEPGFELLGNPAPLYKHLLRKLSRFGASLRSLSIDVSTLADAKVSCFVSNELSAAVTVSGVEVLASIGRPELGLPHAIEFAQATLDAVQMTNLELKLSSQFVANSLWGTPTRGKTNVPWADVAGQILKQPKGVGFDSLAPASLVWVDGLGSTEFRIEASADTAGPLFVRSASTYPPSQDLLSISVQFKAQLTHRLAAVGLYSSQFS